MGVLLLWEQVFMTMLQSGVELTITTFGTLLSAGAEAHDYSLVQEASPARLAPSILHRIAVVPQDFVT